ncbi:MAG: DNA translocase FtsK 4TM domain-containing protein, partial [Oleiphilaceae bacterium]|nr:DNA translocase FtsK 4TM domain-containing protein [Oleiphilaceae bacterium]
MNIIPALNRNSTPKNEQQHFKAYVSHGAREGALILTVAACLFLFMALISHSPSDPGWTSTGSNTIPQNYGGRAGAWFADVLLYFFGYVAYLFPLLIGYRAALIFRHRQQLGAFHWPMFSVRVVGFVLTVLGATGLLAIYSVAGLDTISGGIIGLELSQVMLRTFNLLGSTLLLVSMLLFGLTVFTGISWLGLMDRTGALTLRLYRWLSKQAYFLWDRYQDKRALDRERAEHAPKRKPVTINQRSAEVVEIEHDEGGKIKGVWDKLKHKVAGEERSVKDVEVERQEPVVEAPVQAKAKPKAQSKESTAEHAEAEAQKQIKISPFKKKSKQSSRAEDEKQGNLFIASEGPLPSISLLDPPDNCKKKGFSKEMLQHMSRLLEEKLADFGVSAEVVEVNPGPVITRFEIQPAPGVKVSKISNLAKDLARSLAVLSVRVVEVIPGKSVVGIEIPNEHREIVRFSEVMRSKDYDDAESPLTLGLGNDIAGDPVVVNLAKMPHLLVAGTTGSGKSVGVNSMILSMLFKATPEEVRFIMVDPKMLELSIYDGIPHLLTPVVTDMKEAANALRWCVAEMERRYKLMASLGVRNIAGYNRKVKEAQAAGEPLLDPLWQPNEHLLNEEQDRPELGTLPFIVVVIDEFADMMMIVGKKVEELIARIAQKARAAGIHLILATQRPSVDVITGLIKANVPTRISFQVSSKIDSRTVLDQGGAEQL